MLLRDVLPELFPNDAREISAVTADSRKVVPGSLFFALRGGKADGREFIKDATARGAIIVDHENARRLYALAQKRFYGSRVDEFLNVAVTGTNGKTSVSWLIAEALTALGKNTVHVGTLGMRVVGDEKSLNDPGLTTPDAGSLHKFFADHQKLNALSMEVSAHGISQERAAGIPWSVCIFTNLTRDHLDYYASLEEYGAEKARLFTEELASSSAQKKIAVVNVADEFGAQLAKKLRGVSQIQTVTFSVSGSADARVLQAKKSRKGTELEVEICGKRFTLKSQLIGSYNVENILTAATALIALGYSPEQVAQAIAKVPLVPGRLERASELEPAAFVDYAHTPDALEKAQAALRELTPGKLITVFGCGGDRDRGKRPLMGQAVSALSDLAIVTSDNPRTENPEQIINDIRPGMLGEYEVYIDRREAIARAVAVAGPDDAILIAGKGHEPYQEIKGVKHPFSDKIVAAEIIETKQKRAHAG